MSALRLLTLLAALCCAFAVARADVAVPPLQAHVTDLGGTLSAEQKAVLERELADFEQQKGSQIGVLILPSTEPETIEQYGIRVGEAWKLGRKGVDDGAILIVAKDDHRLRIEVGYGLEGALNDATCKRIIDETIVPLFRQGQFYEGIEAGVQSMLKVVSGEPLPPPAPQAEPYDGPHGNGGAWMVAIVIGAFVASGLLRALFGRPLGSVLAALGAGAAGWYFSGLLIWALVLAVIAFVLTLVGAFGRIGGGGGFGGGGFSGGGGGGFSGGGGSFGGGGASGSW